MGLPFVMSGTRNPLFLIPHREIPGQRPGGMPCTRKHDVDMMGNTATTRGPVLRQLDWVGAGAGKA